MESAARPADSNCRPIIIRIKATATKYGVMSPRDDSQDRPTPGKDGGRGTDAFFWPRDFLDSRFVYAVITPRANGLSLGVNMNPDQKCNFDCVYCEVERQARLRHRSLDVEAMREEFQRALTLVHSGRLRERPAYAKLPAELLKLRHVTLSGDGEPTLCPQCTEAVAAVVHTRARSQFPFFKIVLVTNATGLDLAPVQQGLDMLRREDEIWAKLDAGTQEDMDRVNRPEVSLSKVMGNLLLLGQRRPIVIQSLFPLLNGVEPTEEAIQAYAQKLQELKAGGAMIASVQIYSATRPKHNPACDHLPLKALSRIARTVRAMTGLRVEVF
jgi:wyosine [tRNA(Phe)-imidazoG37] synthetase (radical SAM superfamily)